MFDLQPYKQNYIHFVEAGFIAINQGDEEAAHKLFSAATLLNPENTLPKIGFGYFHLCKLEIKSACQYFEEVLAKEPENEMAKTFLGLSLSFSASKSQEGEDKLKKALDEVKDPQVKSLTKSALSFVEKFIKKPFSH
ncbi:MAG: tetratricopeptide repeat protein [Rhabdochlamydiaceae bacterium]